MAFTEETMRRVREIPIEDAIAPYVALKKEGKNLKGLCPFHNDTSPSFYVNQTKGIYKCFSCGEGGDLIKFFKTLNKTDFTETMLGLCQRHSITPEYEDPRDNERWVTQQTVRAAARKALIAANRFFVASLRRGSVSQHARDYVRSREINRQSIRQFRLGYAPSGNALLSHLLERGFDLEAIEAAGLIKRSDHGDYYDRFRDRLILPLHDERGRIVGFTGRTLCGDSAKYLNSPQGVLFDKGRILFNEYRARRAIAAAGKAVIVEGPLDVIRSVQSGVSNCVAAQGTALNDKTLKRLQNATKGGELLLCLDGDTAGQKATDRVLEMAGISANLVTGLIDLSIVSLPPGSDPDAWALSDPDAYRAAIATPEPWLTWLTKRLKPADDEDIAALNAAVTRLATLLSNIKQDTVRYTQAKAIAAILRPGDANFYECLKSDIRKAAAEVPKPKRVVRFKPNAIEGPELALLQCWLWADRGDYGRIWEISRIVHRWRDCGLCCYPQAWETLLDDEDLRHDHAEASLTGVLPNDVLDFVLYPNDAQLVNLAQIGRAIAATKRAMESLILKRAHQRAVQQQFADRVIL